MRVQPAVVDTLDHLSDEADVSDFGLRDSTHRTAGQHPNPFRLTQAVVQNFPCRVAEVSSGTIPFWPWQ